MARYHLNADGDPKPCTAKIKCPLGGGETEHYASKEEARAAFELDQSAKENMALKSAAERAALRKLPIVLEAFKKGHIGWKTTSNSIIVSYGLKRLRELGFTGERIGVSPGMFGNPILVRVNDGPLTVATWGGENSSRSTTFLHGEGIPYIEIFSNKGIPGGMEVRNYVLSDGNIIDQSRRGSDARLLFERADNTLSDRRKTFYYEELNKTDSTVSFTERLWDSEANIDSVVRWVFDQAGNPISSEILSGESANLNRPPSSAIAQAAFEMCARGEPLGVREALERTVSSRKLAGHLSEELATLRMNQEDALKIANALLS